MTMMIGLWSVEKSVGSLSLGRKRLGLKGSCGRFGYGFANRPGRTLCAQMPDLWDVFAELHLCILWG